jgi:TPP-dependent pyruvate/acetoin dehydrogenase alpha subunit
MNILEHFKHDEIISIVRNLILIRVVEEEVVNKYGKPGEEQHMRCPVHLSIGQEAAAVGACTHLTHNDRIFTTHRCHAHYLAKGGDVRRMVLELHGKMGGCLDGRGGSMHLMDDSVGVIASIPIVSSSIPLAVGSALADKLDGNKNVSYAFFGDASMEEGVFHESANFAAVQQLPVIFVCENNLFSVYTHLSERQPNRDLGKIGEAHGLRVARLDGNNVFEVAAAFKSIVENTRIHNEPSLVVMDTYRWREHCGVNFDDHLGYRDSKEVGWWMERDPVKIASQTVIDAGVLNEGELNAITMRTRAEVATCFEEAIKAPLPSPKMAELYMYA